MSRTQAVLMTLIVYKVVLVVIGVWASKRTRDTADFFLAGRQLGPWIAAISASASSSSAWTLLGVSGAAYLWGLPALWLFPATLLGFLINWLWVGPRLMRLGQRSGAITLTEFIASNAGNRLYQPAVRFASVITLFSFLFYIAAQFQAAGDAFSSTFQLSMRTSILLGGGVVLIYTLLGGFWAVSVTDTLQGLLMAATAALLPATALVAVGGLDGLWAGLLQVSSADELRVTGSHAGFMAAGFVVGTLGIGLGYPGQPHVLNRFMALKNESAMRQGRLIAIGWAVVIYAGMLLTGLCGRVLTEQAAVHEQVFFTLTNQLFPPVVAGIMIAAVLSAIMSTADSQLLVAASAVSHDWRGRSKRHSENALFLSRLTVLILCSLAIGVALLLPETIFTRVLFAWHALGSAFGPTVLAKVSGYQIRPHAILASMVIGFTLTVGFHALPDTPGDFVERLIPFVVALAVVLLGCRKSTKGTGFGATRPKACPQRPKKTKCPKKLF